MAGALLRAPRRSPSRARAWSSGARVGDSGNPAAASSSSSSPTSASPAARSRGGASARAFRRRLTDASVFALPLAGALALALAVSLPDDGLALVRTEPAAVGHDRLPGRRRLGRRLLPLERRLDARQRGRPRRVSTTPRSRSGSPARSLVFGERADLARLLAGGALMAVRGLDRRLGAGGRPAAPRPGGPAR